MALRDILIKFGIEIDQKPIADAESGVEKLVSQFETLAKVAEFAIAKMAADKIVGFFTETLQAANMVDVFAKRLEISTAQVQEFQAMAETTGLQMNFFQHAFRTLNFQVAQSKPEFAELAAAAGGVKFNFKDTGELFWQVGEALTNVSDKSRRAYLAQTLLGRSAQQLLPLFSGTTEEIEAFRKKVQETSEVYSEKFIAKARKSVFEIGVLDRVWRKFGGLLVEQLLPAFDWLVDRFQLVGKWAQEWVNRGEAMNTIITASVIAVGALTVALAPFIAATAAALAPWAALYAVLEDFVTFMRGGDSLIGRFMDKLYGKGGADASRKAIQDLWNDIKAFFKWFSEQGTLGDGLIAVFDKITAAIKVRLDDLAMYITKRLREAFGEKVSDALGLPKLPQAPADQSVGTGYGPPAPPTPPPVEEPSTGLPENPKLSDVFSPTGVAAGAALTAHGIWHGVMKLGNRLADWLTPGVGEGYQPDQDLPAGESMMNVHTIPRLSPSSSNTNVSAPVNVENNITVQGSASAGTAREIAQRTGDATVAAVGGRDRAAIGAAVGLGSR